MSDAGSVAEAKEETKEEEVKVEVPSVPQTEPWNHGVFAWCEDIGLCFVTT